VQRSAILTRKSEILSYRIFPILNLAIGKTAHQGVRLTIGDDISDKSEALIWAL
jgi:hypothetical protein